MQFAFRGHLLDADRRELLRDGVSVPLQPQVFDLLLYLIEHRQRVVDKEELILPVWRGRLVSDSALASRISAARTAVLDNGKDQALIRTIQRRGYRFVGEVAEVGKARTSGMTDQVSTSPSQLALGLPGRPSVAVLAFENMSGDRGQDYFCDGISEDILTALSKVRWFHVVGRNSSFAFKGGAVDLKQVASELDVRYVVEGSMRKDGDRVRIRAALNDAVTGSQVWASQYDRRLADVFAVQDDITNSIVATIEPQIYAAENFRARRKPPNNMDAWDLVIRALSHFWGVTRHDHMAAQALLEKAIAIDPAYGQALAVLANSHMFCAHAGWVDLSTVAPAAERAAMSAVQADCEDAWAHAALGRVCFCTRRLEDSIAEFELALRLNPNFCLARGYYALALSYLGRAPEAFEAARHAIRLSPRDPFQAIYYAVAAYARYIEKDYEQVIALAREAIRQRNLVGAYRSLAAAAGMKGDADLAGEALQELRRLQPNLSLEWIANRLPWKLDCEREHYLEGFRRAGLR